MATLRFIHSLIGVVLFNRMDIMKLVEFPLVANFPLRSDVVYIGHSYRFFV